MRPPFLLPRHDPEKCEAVFRKACPNEKLKRDGDSSRNHRALARERPAHVRQIRHHHPERAARARLQMSALRQGQALCGLSHPAAEVRGVRARLCLHRCRRRPGRVHHPDRRRDRGWLRADRRGQVPAAVLGACGALAAADARRHAVAAARHEVAADRAAIPSQGRRGPIDPKNPEMNEAVRTRSLGFGIFTGVMVAAFVGLGLWQLQRRAEKHELIAALTERLATAPVPLPPPSQWSALTPARDEFRRVSFAAAYARPDAMVYSSGSAVRDDISGPGTWAFLPAKLPTGETVVVNAGFVENTMQDRAVEDRAVARLASDQPVAL